MFSSLHSATSQCVSCSFLQLVERVFDESLNFRKIPPVVPTKAAEINGRPVELRPRAPNSLDPQAALRRRTWNRDEVKPVWTTSFIFQVFMNVCVSEWFSRLQVWKCVILATDENVLFSVAWRVSGDVKTWYDVIKLNYLSVLLTGCCLFGKLLIDTVLMVVLLQAVLDSLLLTSVSQLSSKIRQSVDKTAGKIRSVEEL